jgi:hypothetical protein
VLLLVYSAKNVYDINKITEVAIEVEKTKYVFTAPKTNKGLNHKRKIVDKSFQTVMKNENIKNVVNLGHVSYHPPRIICYSFGYLNI